jgi:Uma2 family endonuclease
MLPFVPPRSTRRATYEDLMEVPDTKVAEIIDGELIVSPRPASPHAHAAVMIGVDLAGPFHGGPGHPAGPGGWWLLLEPELHVREDVLVPDWAGWRREHMPVMPNVAFFVQVPDWVCEVVSPSTGRVDRSRKMRIYAREGVAHLWLVDPLSQTLEAYRLDGDHWVVGGTYGGDDVARVEPFAAVEITLARWWLPS